MKNIFSKFFQELHKDVFFFGVVGTIVGLLHLMESEQGRLQQDSEKLWSTNLINGFVSLEAFILVWIVGVIVAVLAGFTGWERAARTAMHVSQRLLQFSSLMICFSAGIALVALAYSACTRTTVGIAVAVATLLFWLMIAGYTILLSWLCEDKSKVWAPIAGVLAFTAGGLAVWGFFNGTVVS